MARRADGGTLKAVPSLTDSWTLGPLIVPNRVLLAPLAGIGNWCVRLQAKRYGAGLAVSEMVSSHAIHYGNEKTRTELLRTHPDEARVGACGPTSLQLFGQDPEIMRSAAAYVREHVPGVDVIDLNMGCPVPKVCKTGAGAALLKDPDTAVAVARAAAEGSGLPVTVKLRSGQRQGDTSGFHLAKRLVAEAGVAAIGFHPRTANVHHKGTPDYDLAARLVAELDAPVILTGGLHTAAEVRAAFEHTGAEAVMLARGAMGNPWLFSELLGDGRATPAREEVLDELQWLMDRTSSTWAPIAPGASCARPTPGTWNVWARAHCGRELQEALQRSEDVGHARELIAPLRSAWAARGTTA